MTFIALCGDNAPHFTTVAHFVSTLGDDIAPLFARILYLCDQQGLIGRKMFAIDGVKLSSNASKAKSEKWNAWTVDAILSRPQHREAG